MTNNQEMMEPPNSGLALAAAEGTVIPSGRDPLDAALDTIHNFTPKAREYLLRRPHHETHADACKAVGISPNTRDAWRSRIPGFREAEEAILQATGGLKVRLARSIMQAAAPMVAHQQAELATADHDGLSRDQLQAQQRAREQVLKGSGAMEAEVGENELRIDLRVAMRRRLKG